MEWARMLAYITGAVDQELLLRNKYVVAENRILKNQIKTGRTGSGLNIQQKDFQLAQALHKLRILLWSVLQAF